MKIDVVNAENKKVGSLDLNDDVFGGRVKSDLIHESVVRQCGRAPRHARHQDPRDGQRQRQKPRRQRTGRARW
jgi:ribosomal protein L4